MWWNKNKAVKCPKCQGVGFTTAFKGELSSSGDKVEITGKRYELCDKCRGVGITGIKELESLSPQQLQKLVANKSGEELLRLFNNKTPEEIKIILAGV